MSFNQVVDNCFETIKTVDKELKYDGRVMALLYVFSQLKAIGTIQSEIGGPETLYIASKFEKPFVNDSIKNMSQQAVILDINQLKLLTLPATKSTVIASNTTVQSSDDDEDVLAQEGYLDPLPPREMYIDKEYDKLLGIDNE